LSRWKRVGRPKDVDAFVNYDLIKWSRNLKRHLRNEQYLAVSADHFRKAVYRPFNVKYIYLAEIAVDEAGMIDKYFPSENISNENMTICLNAKSISRPFTCLITNMPPDLHYVGDTQCFPYYTYNEDGTNRRENITDWAQAQYRARYGAEVTKWDIFHYVYALLHHPAYRERYAENLKRELPRIPYVPVDDFPRYVETGRALADFHLHYESAPEYPLTWRENNAAPFSWRIEKMKLTRDKDAVIVNDSLTLAGIPPAVYNYRLGNRSALEWVIDQYRVTTDTRSGITSDPNREDDKEYIVRLIGRVVTVSLETVKIISGLPDLGVVNIQ